MTVLEKHGLKLAKPEVTTRLLMALGGKPDCGKTHFAFTAPGPIAYFMGDGAGDEGLIEKFPGKKIYRMDVSIPARTARDPQMWGKESERVWRKFTSAYLDVLYSGEVRTIVWDTGTVFYELARFAHNGRLTGVVSREYGEVNYDFKTLFNAAAQQEKVNLITLWGVKEDYKGDKATGQMKLAGPSQNLAEHAHQTVLEMDRKLVKAAPVWRATFTKCKLDPAWMGQTLDNATFPQVASLLTGTSESDWE